MGTTSKIPSNSMEKTDRFVIWFNKHWVLVFGILFGGFILTPFLAPVFMAIGWTTPGNVIYWIYSFLCHQLPQRSFFLFGPNISYSLTEIQTVWENTNNIVILRQFTGNPQMGWKVAWSDRMVSMYSSIWLFGIIWGLMKKKLKRLPIWGFVILLLPMAIDGSTHFISDLAGIGQGFRDTNTWLAPITNNLMDPNFYAGDAWGSFNAWMRLVSGLLFGLGMVWFGFPYIDESFSYSAEVVLYKIQLQERLVHEKDRLSHLSSGEFLREKTERSIIYTKNE